MLQSTKVQQRICSSQGAKKDVDEGDAECKAEDPVEDEAGKRENSAATDELLQDSGRRTSGQDISQIALSQRWRRRYCVLSELYSMGLKNNGVMSCNKRV